MNADPQPCLQGAAPGRANTLVAISRRPSSFRFRSRDICTDEPGSCGEILPQLSLSSWLDNSCLDNSWLYNNSCSSGPTVWCGHQPAAALYPACCFCPRPRRRRSGKSIDGCIHNNKDTKPQMSSLLVFNRVYVDWRYSQSWAVFSTPSCELLPL
jgi:hypothetical protein